MVNSTFLGEKLEPQLVFGYLLHVNKQLTSVGNSLDEAKALAIPYMAGKAMLLINSAVAPAPPRTWSYDYEIRQWVEFVRG